MVKENISMHNLRDRFATKLADTGWHLFQSINTRLPEGRPFQPGWAPGPLPKSAERSMPPLGFPRQTDSLCPDCVKEVRGEIIAGKRDLRELTEGQPGEITAQLLEKDGRIVVQKTCPVHGCYEDLLSIDAEWSCMANVRQIRITDRHYACRLIPKPGFSTGHFFRL
jgi:hypothetical protein